MRAEAVLAATSLLARGIASVRASLGPVLGRCRPACPGVVLAGLLQLALLGPGGGAAGQVAGVSEERILFGQSASFSGTAAELGTEFRRGLLAAFRERNRRGGVNGRRLELVSMDDGYRPEMAALNTRRLINEQGVFALIGSVGTLTSRAALPVAEAAGVPFVAPLTGAALLRERSARNVVNLRASYGQEIEEIVERLIADLSIVRIGILYQNDSYGRSVLSSAQASVNARGLDLTGVAAYRQGTTAIKAALLDLRAARPAAVIVAGTAKAAAAATSWSRRIGFNPVFATLSFAGSNILPSELGAGARLFVTQVVPDPYDTTPSAEAYRKALAELDEDAAPSFVSYEGYLAGRVAAIGLLRCGDDLTRELFLQKILQGVVTVDGIRFRFGRGDSQGLDQVFLTMVGRGRRFVQVTGFDAAFGR